MILQHNHLIVRAEVTQPPKSIEEVTKWVTELVPKIKMKLLGEPQAYYVDKKGNKGATCVAVIETSHIALHVWDEKNPSMLQLDVYTCSDMHENKIFKHLEQFKPIKVQYKILDRDRSLITVPQMSDLAYSTASALESIKNGV
jgi:S-adenosylmethionine/arginine decarboxylase-like enzyme